MAQSVVEIVIVSALKGVIGYVAVVVFKPALDWLAGKFRNLFKSKDNKNPPEGNSKKNSGP